MWTNVRSLYAVCHFLLPFRCSFFRPRAEIAIEFPKNAPFYFNSWDPLITSKATCLSPFTCQPPHIWTFTPISKICYLAASLWHFERVIVDFLEFSIKSFETSQEEKHVLYLSPRVWSFYERNFKGVWRIKPMHKPIGDKRDVLRGFRISDVKTLSLAEGRALTRNLTRRSSATHKLLYIPIPPLECKSKELASCGVQRRAKLTMPPRFYDWVKALAQL